MKERKSSKEKQTITHCESRETESSTSSIENEVIVIDNHNSAGTLMKRIVLKKQRVRKKIYY